MLDKIISVKERHKGCVHHWSNLVHIELSRSESHALYLGLLEIFSGSASQLSEGLTSLGTLERRILKDDNGLLARKRHLIAIDLVHKMRLKIRKNSILAWDTFVGLFTVTPWSAAELFTMNKGR
jgi:hypothetical protein